MIVYFDSSMLVKRYVEEEQSGDAAALWKQSSEAACSAIGFAEVLSALYRRTREGTISREHLGFLLDKLQEDWAGMIQVALSGDVNLLVGSLLTRRSLRAMDVIHLASALSPQRDTGRDILFACDDLRLTSTARAEGMNVFPELTP